jgi:HK97 family phage major capsid protein
MKFLIEKRNSIVEEINKMFEAAETEKRALTDEEQSAFEAKTAELKALDKTIEAKREARSLEMMEEETPKTPEQKQEERSIEETEKRAFEALIRENRAGEMAKTDNGAVIPTTIANQIIDRVKQIAPLYALATKFNVKGDLTFPVGKDAITTAYQEEFKALTSSKVGFDSLKLGGHLVGALSKISNSLINNSQFDIVSYVVNKVAESIALFIENELINGTEKIHGVLDTTNNTTVEKFATTADMPTVDELIAMQVKVPQQFQGGCMWLVSNNTLVALRQLKDGNQRYLLQDDVTNGFGYTLLGKPVMVSDNMKDTNVVYGDFSAMYVNVHEDVAIQVLAEKYADEHATGVLAWLELDARVIEPQKIVVSAKNAVSARAAKATKAE